MAHGLWSTGSTVMAHRLVALQRDPPRSGIEPMSPALAGRFFITEPPGKPCVYVLKDKMHHKFMLIFLIQIQGYRI